MSMLEGLCFLGRSLPVPLRTTRAQNAFLNGFSARAILGIPWHELSAAHSCTSSEHEVSSSGKNVLGISGDFSSLSERGFISYVMAVACHTCVMAIMNLTKNSSYRTFLKTIINPFHLMMTSSEGNIFRVTGHLCGEFTHHRWIPRTKASDAELWYFYSIYTWINGSVNNR